MALPTPSESGLPVHDLPRPVRWGIVGPGEIARVFGRACVESGAGAITAVLGRSEERARIFADSFGARAVASPEALLADESIDAIYVSTPHLQHEAYVHKAIEAGKAVLCEKPLTTSAAQTHSLCELAKDRGVLLVEGWMYRAHPQIDEMVRLIQDNAIGEVSRVRACFGVACEEHLPERVLAPELAGGVIYDIGGYPISAAFLVDRCVGGDGEIRSIGQFQFELTERGVELDTSCTIEFGSGIQADLACSFRRDLGLSVEVIGTQGRLLIPDAFLPEGDRNGRRGLIEIENQHGHQRVQVDSERCCFSLEAVAFAELLEHKVSSARFPMVDLRESAQIASVIDRWKSVINKPSNSTSQRSTLPNVAEHQRGSR